ncbi:MAG: alpha/beta hydrolase [Chloroflexi bacterium]|nr:alpha/beta hydrolase [Chloroflexota bacterium]
MENAVKGSWDYVWRPDGVVYYEKLGKGEPLIFLHHIELGGWIWKRVIDKFAEHFTCYNISHPGVDHSDTPPRKYSMDDYAKAFIDVMDKLGIGQANIIGSHGGCVMAVAMAVNYPRRVKKLVFDGLPYWDERRGRIVFEQHWMPTYTDTTWCDIPVPALRSWEEASKTNPTLDREYFELSQAGLRKTRRWYRLSAEALTSYDVEAAGPKIRAPVLMVHGETDLLRRGEQRALEGIKGAVLKVVAGCSAPFWEKPEEATKLALEFLLARR